ncbi:MAG TPA: hypothetical protein VFF67_10680 [Thermoplasmata archaeon]|nr:hypothetical protein [Thermoplasmata archaeon]
MSDPSAEPAPSLLRVTVRRSIVAGRIYLAIGAGVSVLIGSALSLTAGAGLSLGFPLLFPVYATVGGIGGLMVFTDDRIKGVLEYLMAYGVSPRRLFVNVLISAMVLVSIVLTLSVGTALGLLVGRGLTIPPVLLEVLVVYSIPMTFASVAFAATVGMFWTSLSSPREGMNSPAGLAPILGVGPPVLTLIAVGLAPADFLTVLAGAVLAMVVLVTLLVNNVNRLLPRERLLSPA